MIYNIADTLKQLLDDMETGKREGDWIVPLTCDPMWTACMALLRELITGLDKYFVSNNIDDLHKDLITAGLDFCSRWERWLENLPTDAFESTATKAFHISLLRLSKGIIKSYRIWRIDSLL